MSRGVFVRSMAGAAALATGAGLGTPAVADAKPKGTSSPKPIPQGIPLGPPLGTIHVLVPGHPAFPFSINAEPATITDFNGFLGYAVVQGTGTGTTNGGTGTGAGTGAGTGTGTGVGTER